MARDMWTMINRELAKIEQAKGGISDTPYLEELGEMARYAERDKIYREKELTDRGASLSQFIQVIDNSTSLDEFENQLNLYKKDAGKSAEHQINAMMLREGFNTKKQQFADYGTSIQAASDFIDSAEFLTEQKDFENLSATFDSVNQKRIDNNEKPHGSTMEYVRSEIDRVKGLMGKIAPGMRFDEASGAAQQGFKYKEFEINNVDTFNKLKKYGEQLDVATRALYVDGVINEGEAQAILIGDIEFYNRARDGAESESKAMFDDARTQWNFWKKAQITDKFDEDDLLKLSGFQQNNLESGNEETKKQVLVDMVAQYREEMAAQDKKHYNWTGRKLQQKPEDISFEEISGFDQPPLQPYYGEPLPEIVRKRLYPEKEKKVTTIVDPVKEASGVETWAVGDVKEQSDVVNKAYKELEDFQYDSSVRISPHGKPLKRPEVDVPEETSAIEEITSLLEPSKKWESAADKSRREKEAEKKIKLLKQKGLVKQKDRKGRQYKTNLEKHLNLDAGTTISIEQLKQVESDYNSDMATLEKVQAGMTDLVDYARENPEDKYTAGGRDPRKWEGWNKLEAFKKQMKEIMLKWRVTKTGELRGDIMSERGLLSELKSGLRMHEGLKFEYDKQLEKLETIKTAGQPVTKR